jgi:hypothetical protein
MGNSHKKIKFSCGGHLDRRSEMPDTILEGAHPRINSAKLVEISSVVLEEKILFNSHALHPRWPPLLKIEISSNVQNCFILRQNVPKFELYKHNDEFFLEGDHPRINSAKLVEISSVVLEEKIFFLFHPSFF